MNDLFDAHEAAGQRRGMFDVPFVRDVLIGRESDLVRARALLLREDVGLLSLTGAGGVGKTRFALELARDVADNFEDGVFFVRLESLTDPAQVAITIGREIGLDDFSEGLPEQILRTYLARKRALLLMDNFEHVVEAAPLIGDLLSHAPGLTVLVTSRSSLRLHAEHEYVIQPLSMPSPGKQQSAGDLLTYGSVALFVRRVEASLPTFSVTENDVPTVAEICRRLDGLPLALELAAARMKLLSPKALLGLLDDGLHVLAGGSRDRPARQQTMQATIAWSYDLLSPDEQRLFEHLAVFNGGASLAAVQALSPETGASEGWSIDTLEALVDQNLIQRQDDEDEFPRFMMLSTIREFALDRASASHRLLSVQRLHAEYFAELAEQAHRGLRSRDDRSWLRRLKNESGNFRAALAWSLSTEDDAALDIGLRLAVALTDGLWRPNGQHAEGRQWIGSLLHGRQQVADGLSARALTVLGTLARDQGEYDAASTYFDEAIQLSGEIGESAALARALRESGEIAAVRGDYDRAEAACQAGLTASRTLGDPSEEALAYHFLAIVAHRRGDAARAAMLFKESLRLSRVGKHQLGVVTSLWQLGRAMRDLKRIEEAEACYREALDIARERGDRRDSAWILFSLGSLAYDRHDLARAVRLLQESLDSFAASFTPRGMMFCVHTLGLIARDTGDVERAVFLLAAADAMRAGIGAVWWKRQRDRYERELPLLRASVGTKAFNAAWADGWDAAPEKAIESARAVVSSVPETATAHPVELPTPSITVSPLTHRELEVAKLLARGYTNSQVAEALVITVRTAETHVRNIREKLGFSTRAQIAVWFVQGRVDT